MEDYYDVDFDIKTVYDLLCRKSLNNNLIGEQVKDDTLKTYYEWTTYNQVI